MTGIFSAGFTFVCIAAVSLIVLCSWNGTPMPESDCPLGLDARFSMPDGWRWNRFENDGHALRYGFVSPQEPAAIVVGLQGLSEFSEKYFEVARDMLARNFAFCMMDWRGQGKSDRYFTDDREKRHSEGFDHDIADLHRFIGDHVQPMARRTDGQFLPLVMLAHSMGGNIGIRYLENHPGLFTCAAFTAPLLGIKAIEWMPMPLRTGLSSMLNALASSSYTLSAGQWSPVEEKAGEGKLSSDPQRAGLMDSWFRADAELRAGGVTYGWVRAAIRSCRAALDPVRLKKIDCPVLIATAGRETLVDNTAIRRAATIAPNCRLLELPGAKHEILMEKDEYRNAFLRAFDELVSA